VDARDDEWPGAERRRPPLRSSTWVVRAPLADWLTREGRRAAAEFGRYRLLDVGCGVKPYAPFFAPEAEYVGVDVVDNPAADLRGAVESLPVGDGSFELVLCTQVLEHCADPALAVRELRRVVAPGGRVLASTHGVQVYHPSPEDHWRWTHTGLERLFAANGDWRSLHVEAALGTASCVAMLLGIYVEIAARRARVPAAGGALVAGLNRAGAALDRRSRLLGDIRPGALVANYLVTAEAPAQGTVR
jgi:SAM-dependent methyltransferase